MAAGKLYRVHDSARFRRVESGRLVDYPGGSQVRLTDEEYGRMKHIVDGVSEAPATRAAETDESEKTPRKAAFRAVSGGSQETEE